MKVIDVNTFRDGGTADVKTDEGHYYVDNRIVVPENPTRLEVFSEWPIDENSTPIEKRKVCELVSALDKFGGHSIDIGPLVTEMLMYHGIFL